MFYFTIHHYFNKNWIHLLFFMCLILPLPFRTVKGLDKLNAEHWKKLKAWLFYQSFTIYTSIPPQLLEVSCSAHVLFWNIRWTALYIKNPSDSNVGNSAVYFTMVLKQISLSVNSPLVWNRDKCLSNEDTVHESPRTCFLCSF